MNPNEKEIRASIEILNKKYFSQMYSSPGAYIEIKVDNDINDAILNLISVAQSHLQAASELPKKHHVMENLLCGDPLCQREVHRIGSNSMIDQVTPILAKKNEEVTRLKNELFDLRSYCTLTFGESHPEIKKCPHEIKVEQLQSSLALKSARVEELEEKNIRLTEMLFGDSSEVGDKYTPNELKIQELEKKIASLEDALKKSEIENNSFKSSGDNRVLYIAGLQKRISELEDALKRAEGKNKELKNEASELRAKYSRLRIENGKLDHKLEDDLGSTEKAKTKCSRCGYEGQDTSKYDGLCYQCYADKNNIQ